jgi:hypothetical protein
MEFNPGGASGLNHAVKLRYEANADTNAFTDAEKTKLAGIASAATANATDAQLRDRSTHTGTQAASTITGTKTSSFISDFASAVAALITGKQDTLVSGTSIKTVNGTSLLGSGNISVEGGGAANLDGYTQMVPAAGQFVANSANATALSTAAQVANRMVIAPFVAAYTMNIDQLGVSISTLLASSFAKCVVYAADSTTGRPTTVLRETGDIDCSTTGTKFADITSLTLTAGLTYWIGVRTSSTFTLRTLGGGALPALDYTNAATPAPRQTFSRTLTYATAADTWTYSTSHHSTVPMPLVLMRLA